MLLAMRIILHDSAHCTAWVNRERLQCAPHGAKPLPVFQFVDTSVWQIVNGQLYIYFYKNIAGCKY